MYVYMWCLYWSYVLICLILSNIVELNSYIIIEFDYYNWIYWNLDDADGRGKGVDYHSVLISDDKGCND